jgi:hypothetical protein
LNCSSLPNKRSLYLFLKVKAQLGYLLNGLSRWTQSKSPKLFTQICEFYFFLQI